MRLVSSAFADHGAIPRRYTCDGEGLSPPLAWSEVPPGVKSFALLVDDPDAPDPSAPTMIWVHWIVYNLPAGSSGLAEGALPLPAGALEGLNDWKRPGYRGPCPPAGRHRYFHKLYALDVELPELKRPTRAKLEAAMRRHVLAEATLVGTYQRTRRGS
jgi:Raf kinase inhibitor-like YbhB/YbcL family protein